MDLDNIFYICCPWTKGVPLPWPKVIPQRSRSQCTHAQNLYLGHNSLLSSWMGMILHFIVVDDTGVVVGRGICPIWTCLVRLYTRVVTLMKSTELRLSLVTFIICSRSKHKLGWPFCLILFSVMVVITDPILCMCIDLDEIYSETCLNWYSFRPRKNIGLDRLSDR